MKYELVTYGPYHKIKSFDEIHWTSVTTDVLLLFGTGVKSLEDTVSVVVVIFDRQVQSTRSDLVEILSLSNHDPRKQFQ